ncbi:hypothetical protein STENM223S_09532 [Streptomyces tendae]
MIPGRWGVYQTLALSVPSRLGMLIPDLVVTQLPDHSESDTHIPAALAELVVEVTSKSNARHDRISKPAACATAGIPLYLLVDRWAPGGPTATLYGEPKGDVYRVLSAAKFGDPLTLPAPFDLTIDTGEFPEVRFTPAPPPPPPAPAPTPPSRPGSRPGPGARRRRR